MRKEKTMTERLENASPENTLIAEILAELQRARSKFPGDNCTTLAMAEEAGELCTSVFEEPRSAVRKEAVQTAVMAMRVVLDGDATVRLWRAMQGLDPLVAGETLSGAEMIAVERARQVHEEGWTEDHDDDHRNGELARAAVTYCLTAHPRGLDDLSEAARFWPFDGDWLKPRSKIEDLVRAGALIAAEIDRLNRNGNPSQDRDSSPIAATLTYLNWRGEVSDRVIIPRRVWFGSTEWHPEPQWFLTAWDAEKNAERDFALSDFIGRPDALAARDAKMRAEGMRMAADLFTGSDLWEEAGIREWILAAAQTAADSVMGRA